MIQNQEQSLPIYLDNMNVNQEFLQSNRKTTLNQQSMRQRNATVNISNSFHQDLITNESEGDLLLNYSDIQQNILKDFKSRSRNYSELRQSVLNSNENNPNAQSKFLTRAFYSKQRVLKYQNRSNETTHLSYTPQKQQNINVSTDAAVNFQRQIIRRTATASHPSDIRFINYRDDVSSSRGRFQTNYSLNKIKSSMKQTKETQRQRMYTLQDTFVLEGRNAGIERSLDQSTILNQLPFNNSKYEKDQGKKKKVIYSKKSTSPLNNCNDNINAIEKSKLYEKQDFLLKELVNSSQDYHQLSAVIQNESQNIKKSQIVSPRILEIETPSFKQQQLSPIMFENHHQKFRPRKLAASPYSRQNTKQRNDSQNNLQSNYQQNYLSLFPLKDSKFPDSQTKDCKNQLNNSHQNTDQNVNQQQQNLQYFPYKKINPKFEFLHMSQLNNETAVTQAPYFQRTEILNQFYPKVFPSKKLKPIKIYEIY
ncbi:hypothetical protein TTHERM_00294880 (macronuclear) [Tetrahymena thermophila SB210]|uniref:Uncharacterized protein n=1 Tax=Tetrahymena thermophila (strain SB210) TaxID=312017 RepID=I7M7E9_TETTS|nr:hypothetical protein TTHERM_00294880 [Tetrahymena thermophila SB210]EAR92875.1 hypothetical protein TTHERM_00294880 [Tetrahymena thermophila SB210]|eukprot:XP_001013120.1 hypothetical protein TTHERM_00294880 [Tetrahymena thermophila SB210]